MRCLLVLVVFLLSQSSATGRPAGAGFSRRSLLSGNVTRVDESNKKSINSIVAGALPGSVVTVDFGEIELTESLEPSGDVTIIGIANGKKPRMKCPEGQPAILVKLKGVKLVNIEIQGCSNTAVHVAPAISEETCMISVSEVTFTNNGNLDNDLGGAMRLDSNSHAVISNCDFSGNKAKRGGGVYAMDSILTVRNSSFVGNSALSNGGAIYDRDRTSVQPGGEGLLEISSEMNLEVSYSTFENNSVTVGMEDRTGLLNVLGAPLEDSQFLLLVHSGTSGGGIFVTGLGLVSIHNCRFVANKAPAGGAIFLGNNQNTLIGNTGFHDNIVQDVSEETKSNKPATGLFFPSLRSTLDERGMHGGAIYAASTATGSISIRSSSFLRNSGMYGGALHVVAPKFAKFTLSKTTFDGNKAVIAGGGAIIRNVLNVQLNGVGFFNNRGDSGGGLLVTNGAEAVLGPGCRIQSNHALEGGGLMSFGAGDVLLEGVSIVGNVAQHTGGGASFVASIATSPVALQDVNFTGNTAMYGGGSYIDDVSEIDIRGRTSFGSNKALSGGGILIAMESRIRNQILFSDTSFHGNMAGEDACGVDKLKGLLCESPRDDVPSCGTGGGGAVCLVLDNLPSQAPATVQLRGARFASNTAKSGGALHAKMGGQDWKQSCPLKVSRPQGNPCRTLQLINPIFSSGNSANDIFANDSSLIYISEGAPAIGSPAFRQLSDFLSKSGNGGDS